MISQQMRLLFQLFDFGVFELSIVSLSLRACMVLAVEIDTFCAAHSRSVYSHFHTFSGTLHVVARQ